MLKRLPKSTQVTRPQQEQERQAGDHQQEIDEDAEQDAEALDGALAQPGDAAQEPAEAALRIEAGGDRRIGSGGGGGRAPSISMPVRKICCAMKLASER